VSLIMEALKKLERERDTQGSGFLVLAPTPWPATRGRILRVALLALVAGAFAGGSGWAVWQLLARHDAPAAVAEAPRPATRPAPEGSASPVAAIAPPIWDAGSRPPVPAATRPPASTVPRPAAVAPDRAAAAPAPAAPEPVFRLEAVSSQDGHPVAVINGQLVREGETVDGARVVHIAADHVELEVQGRRRVIGF